MKSHLLASVALTLCAVATVTPSQAAAAQQQAISIPAGDLKSALNAYVRQTGRQVIYRADQVRGIHSPGARGNLSADEALSALLSGTGFVARTDASGAIAIVSAVGNGASVPNSAASSGEDVAARAPAAGESGDNQTIVVTGTNLRGIAPSSSPLSIYNRKAIEQTGASTLQDFLRYVPSNFGGGSTEYAPFGFQDDVNSQSNFGYGSGVNLRGLGSGSTLVLLNGHRLAPASGIGDFVDISMIPVSAVERVDILTDGASAIYGGDAVAGVVNFILRRNYDGAEVSARYGTDTGSDMQEFQFSSTIGHSWRSGNVLVSYDFSRRGELAAEERSYTENLPLLPSTNLPGYKRHNGLASFSQDLTPNLSFHTDALYGHREATAHFHTSPESSPFTDNSTSKQISIASGLDYNISESWVVSGSGSYSRVTTNRERSGGFNSKLYARSSEWDANIKATGDVVSLPGGAAKLAIGAHHRREELTGKFTNTDTGAPPVTGPSEGRTVNAAFAELFVPLVGSENAVPVINRLELNLSYRYENYSDFGSNWSPKAGLMWSPIEDLRLRTSYSKSFDPPSLGRVGATDSSGGAYTNDIINLFFSFPVEVPDPSVGLIFFGTDDHLKPERSRSWTAGLDFDRDTTVGKVHFSSTFFDIDFKNRIDTPVVPFGAFNVRNLFLSDPSSLPPGLMIDNPTVEQVNAALAAAQAEDGFFDFFGVYSGPQNVEWLETFVTGNRSETNVRGLDLNATLTKHFARGTLTLSASGTRLFEFKKRNSPTSVSVDILNTPYNPVSFRGRAGATYSTGGFLGGLFANYVTDYRDNRQVPTVPVRSWTTFDLVAQYAFPAQSRFRGFELDFNVTNWFNRDPPSIASNQFVPQPYDPANASPVGRFISARLTKRW